MPNKTSRKAADLFLTRKAGKVSSNTYVDVNDEGVSTLYLHHSPIALYDGQRLRINNHGYTTHTTKERLNALPGVNIYQKNWTWYLNEVEMPVDTWVEV